MIRHYMLLLCIICCLTACGAPSAAGGGGTPISAAATTAPTVVQPIVTIAASPTVAPRALPSATVAPTTAPTVVATATAVAAEPTAIPQTDATHDTPSLTNQQGQQTAPTEPVIGSVDEAAAAAASEPVRLVIEPIDMDRKLVSVGLDENRSPIVPNHDAAWYNLSAKPGQGENVVLWGHVLRFKNAPDIPAPFGRLKDVPIGARITLYTADGKSYHYVVSQKVFAQPDQVEYILPVGHERLTLVSCIGDKVIVDGSVEMTNRLITIAEPET